MDFELRLARSKLEREQKERKERAKQKLERERKAKQEAVRQREAIEVAQRTRRLDALQAQIKADQLTEENLIAGNGIMFYSILEAVPGQGFGDKIKLPPSCFTELSNQGALDKGPMYFRLSKVHQDGPADSVLTEHQNQEATHSGVLEFTSPNGTVELPPHVWNNLFPDAPVGVPLVEVRYVRLPKGTYAKLQPDGRGFSDIPNHKAVLETSLRNNATLSQGDVIAVKHGELSYNLRVLELKPSSSVSVLETDIEVDVVGADSSSDWMDNHVLKPLEIGKTESGLVEEGKYIYYKFSVDGDVSSIIASEDAHIEIKLEAGEGGDTDLYVSKHPVLFPNQHQHEWSSHDVGSKVLILSPKAQCLDGAYSIGVFGFKGTTKYQISIAIHGNSGRYINEQPSSSSSAVEAGSAECQNCRRYIPSRTIALHEAYCSRHNVVCEHAGCKVVLRREEAANHVHCKKCGRAFQQQEMEKHMKVFHEPLHCACGVILEKEEMVQHQSSSCPLRLVVCRFCGDMVQAGSSASDARDRLRGLSEHESQCGSRTAPCDSCGRAVMLKEMDIHRIAVHSQN
ncbi:hypothetical protein Scep_012806 [Stephania cephalantha]|uniref:Uncharacterized protein n=1 Tax=Stephania cephalantha TaxID=152367 RepID=A0AAP0JHL1_9MAGN